MGTRRLRADGEGGEFWITHEAEALIGGQPQY